MMEPRQIRNPFPGLRPFETDEYRLFFGREGQSDELIARLQRARFLAVVGASGSGKSSLIRAGLLPALRGGLMAGAGSGWRIAVIRPGGDPIGNLASELAKKDALSEAGAGLISAEAEAVIEATLRGGSLGLVDVARQGRLAANEKLLVVVDQFEELFRFRAAARERTCTDDEASAFVKLLLEASQQRDLSIYVVLTMRSDFLGDCAQFQGLPEAINDGQYLIPRQTRDERRVAITGPVGVTRGKITEPLVNRLLNDVGDNPDQLPILQHALMRTWDHWAAHRRNGEPIGIEHYQAIGTMADALSLHADEAFNELPDDRSRLIAEIVFKALSERGADNREIRRPTRLNEICNIANASRQEVIAVIDVFRGGGRSFLMPPAGVALEPETVIDISHESLIRNWRRLKDWVGEEAHSARIYRRLAEAAVLNREGSEGLLQDPALQIALDWRERSRPNAAWGRRYHPEFETAIAYLDESRAAREARVAAAEREREEQLARERRELEMAKHYAEEQRRAAQRLRRFTFALVLISLLALTAAGVSVYAFGRARSSASQARESAEQARKNEILARERESVVAQTLKVKEEAERQRLKADEKRAKAEKSEEKARASEQLALKTAVAEKKRAVERAREARDAQVRAETEARKNLKAKEANDNFRGAVVLAQRGSYEQADKRFVSAIEGYRDKTLSDHEAEADADAERGHLSFVRGYTKFIQKSGHSEMDQTIQWDLKSMVEHYDHAAETYAGVAAPGKAAASLFSLGTSLMKFASDPPAVQGLSRDELSEMLVGKSAESASPDLGITPKHVKKYQQSLGEVWTPKDLRKMAVKRFEGALHYYQQVYEKLSRAKDPDGEDREAERANTGRKNSAFQVADISLREANEIEDTPGNHDEVVPLRRRAVSHFELMLGFYKSLGTDESARILVWLGGLYKDLRDTATSESYFERAIAAHVSLEVYRADALSSMAQIAEGAGQRRAALDLYRRALEAQKADEVDLLSRANAHYGIGRVLEKESGETSFEEAMEIYRQAVVTYREALAKSPKEASAESDEIGRLAKNLLHIGGVARGINVDFAIEAYELAVSFTDHATGGDLMRDRARAYAEIGAIRIGMNRPQPAIESYQSALKIYRDVAQDMLSVEGSKEDAKEEVKRIVKILKALSKGSKPLARATVSSVEAVLGSESDRGRPDSLRGSSGRFGVVPSIDILLHFNMRLRRYALPNDRIFFPLVYPPTTRTSLKVGRPLKELGLACVTLVGTRPAGRAGCSATPGTLRLQRARME